MANKKLFKSNTSSVVNVLTNAVNSAGGAAYSRSDEEALAVLACTGTFNGTFYNSGEDTLNEVISRVSKVRPEFLAKLAVYSAEEGFMKDSSALLLASLMVLDNELFKKAFPRIVRNGKMLRNFCQIVRSGRVGRKSFGSSAKRLVQNWLNGRTDRQLFEDTIGNEPTLADIIKMVHPKPNTPSRAAFYAYVLGKEHDASALPDIVKEFELFKKGSPGQRVVPNVSFQHLTAANLSESEWKDIASNAAFHMTRMNLSTFCRHGVFNDEVLTQKIVDRLSSEENVRKARVFPYQLYTSYLYADAGTPSKVREALGVAMEYATRNIPIFSGKTIVAVDYSGSMGAPVTGNRGSATSKVSCIQAASLIASCVTRNCSDYIAYRFDTEAYEVALKRENTVFQNANLLNANGGGTDCAAPIRDANKKNLMADTIIILSDNESWSNPYGSGKTNLMVEWTKFKKRNPKAKLVLIDLAGTVTTQANTSAKNDVLCVAGFSDACFEAIGAFLSGAQNAWTTKIESIEL